MCDCGGLPNKQLSLLYIGCYVAGVLNLVLAVVVSIRGSMFMYHEDCCIGSESFAITVPFLHAVASVFLILGTFQKAWIHRLPFLLTGFLLAIFHFSNLIIYFAQNTSRGFLTPALDFFSLFIVGASVTLDLLSVVVVLQKKPMALSDQDQLPLQTSERSNEPLGSSEVLKLKSEVSSYFKVKAAPRDT